ncbi:MAG: peptidylprolyl isomerase [Bacteroidetes bacterium]|nr:peptidylprolyl isomerase [Bacteroidota bacterium]
MKAKTNMVVSLMYELKEDDHNGQIIEKVEQDEALTFLMGAQNMLPDFEKNIEGLEVGSKFEFKITAENAYGEFIQEAVVKLPIDTFVIDGKLADDMLKVGNVVPMKDGEGNQLHGRILAVETNEVSMDFNHPLAGMNLFFKGEVTNIREASQEELQHGHIHGSSCDHHHSEEDCCGNHGHCDH